MTNTNNMEELLLGHIISEKQLLKKKNKQDVTEKKASIS